MTLRIFLLIALTLCAHSLRSSDEIIDRRGLLVYTEPGEAPLLNPKIGKRVVETLMATNDEKFRLENKRVVREEDVLDMISYLELQGYPLIEREVKNLRATAKAGTFTFYGTAVKFVESKQLPKTSIKLRIRIYIVEENGITKRSDLTSTSAFLELKIKNPFPEYPLSVHKYRLLLPDKDVLTLIKSDPNNQRKFSATINKLENKAHYRDVDGKNAKLITAMFQQIKIIAIAQPFFIKPSIGITYHRISKKYDEEYDALKKKKKFLRKEKWEKKTRSYEITIDNNLKAFYVYFFDNPHALNIDKYFVDEGFNNLLIAAYPSNMRVVEFKQPDAIGYQGEGIIRGPDAMQGAQRELWLAFVDELGKRAVPGSSKDRGKFFHVKQFMRISKGHGRPGETSILQSIKDIKDKKSETSFENVPRNHQSEMEKEKTT